MISDLDRWRSSEGILYSTIRGFKGLEANAIVMIDLPEPDSVPHFTRADFYVGSSRAKHLLVMLPNEKNIP